MNGRHLLRLVAFAGADLADIEANLLARLAEMDDASKAWPRGRSFDTGPGRTSVTFCEIHERERCECGEGTTYATPPDPTGETAMLPDRVDRDRSELEKALKAVDRNVRAARLILSRYQPRAATTTERAETLGVTERLDGCWSCARTKAAKGIERWEPAEKRPTLDGHIRPLCGWCYDWLRAVGDMPTVANVEDHHQGKRVKRPAAKALAL